MALTDLATNSSSCRKGRKRCKVRCSSPFFVAGGGWKGGQKSVVDVVCVLGWYSLKPSSA